MEDEIINGGSKIDFEIFEGSLAENIIPKLKPLPKDDIFQINGETGEAQTFHEFLKAGLQVAEGLKALGVKEGEVIALVGNYSSKIFAAAFADVAIGAPIFPIDPSFNTFEFKHFFLLSEPEVIFCEPECSKHVIEALDLTKNKADVVLLGDDEILNTRLKKFSSILKDVDVENYQPLPVKNPSEQVILIIVSSGTTGFPKAVEITHRNLNFQCELMMNAPEMSQKNHIYKLQAYLGVQKYWL